MTLPAPSPAFLGRFDLDIGLAIADQLGAFLNALHPEPLANVAALAAVPGEGGIYRLYHAGGPVYVGKADNLRARLNQHASDLDGRQNISRQEVAFVCATLSKNWAPFGPEDILMRRDRLAWQNSGFGNNDPGRRRDHSAVPPEHWDAQFPIRLEWACERIAPGEYAVSDLLESLKATLPFLFRFERTGQGWHTPNHPDVAAARIAIPRASMPFWELMGLVVALLPGWQATALPGYTILYKENALYTSALAILRGP